MRPALLLFLLFLFAGCERPFVPEEEPDITVVSPDLDVVQIDARLKLQVRADGLRTIDTVTVNGTMLAYEADGALWRGAVDLAPGLNRLVLEATDVSGLAGRDTAYAFYWPSRFRLHDLTLPEPRGGHAATRLPGNQILVTGGAPNVGAEAVSRALLAQPGSERFRILPEQMLAPRIWHTATLLPDGRVLLLGGSRTVQVEALDALVDVVEVYDPQQERFLPIVYDGPPIRRAQHTASVRTLDDRVLVDVFGGVGDIRYGSDPRLGVRDDMSTYELSNDTLLLRSPAVGYRFEYGGRAAGHTQTLLDAGMGPARYLVAGTLFSAGGTETTSFLLELGGLEVLDFPAAAPLTPRTLHAAERLRPGVVLLVGGTQREANDALFGPELYAAEADRYFRLPNSTYPTVPIRRFGLTATSFGVNRILALGGFLANGNGATLAEVFEPALF